MVRPYLLRNVSVCVRVCVCVWIVHGAGHMLHRRLADGNVNCAGSATYEICFRLPIPNPNPNPKINKKTKRHRNEIEHRVISKNRFPRDGGGFIKVTRTGIETHMDIPVF